MGAIDKKPLDSTQGNQVYVEYKVKVITAKQWIVVYKMMVMDAVTSLLAMVVLWSIGYTLLVHWQILSCQWKRHVAWIEDHFPSIAESHEKEKAEKAERLAKNKARLGLSKKTGSDKTP